jgi:thymidylate synthase
MPNCYGLSGLQERVAKELSLDVGALTMYCNSLAIDPQSDKMAAAKAIEKRWRGASRPGSSGDRNGIGGDPRGYFIVEADRAACTIVASQYVDGLLVRRYTARRAEVLQRYIVRDMAVSDLSHALWLGQELARAEFALNCDERTGV